MPSNNIFIQN